MPNKVIIDLNYRLVDNKGNARVGWSLPTKANPLYPYQRMTMMTPELQAAGFKIAKLPPSPKAGSGQFSDGYDIFDPYDLGSKNQKGSKNTAYGTVDQLRQLVATMHSNDIDVWGDLVVHQYGGGTANGVYKYLGADGKTLNGRFAKTASCFVGAPPRVPADPVPDSNGNFAFGDMASYVHSKPNGYMWINAIRNALWQQQTIGFDGWRIDDVKGTNAGFVLATLKSLGLNAGNAVGEYFDGNPANLNRWAMSDVNGLSSVYDFGFKFNVQNICNNNSSVWMGQLANISYVTQNPFNCVTFIDSTDTDTSPGEQTIWNKALGYAIMLTFPGQPQVFYRDWSTDPYCYGLKPIINNLIYINYHFANGNFVPRFYNHPQVFAHERTGYQDELGGMFFFNNDQHNSYTITTQTSLPASTRLHEYSGNSGYMSDKWTNSDGSLTVTVPPNNNGMSYLAYARYIESSAFGLRPRTTTQVFSGAGSNDLDIPGLGNTPITVGDIYCAANTKINCKLEVKGYNGAAIAEQVQIIDPNDEVTTKATIAGCYTLALKGISTLPANTLLDFELTVTYTAPREYDVEEMQRKQWHEVSEIGVKPTYEQQMMVNSYHNLRTMRRRLIHANL